jgi:hypothetical protein
MYEGSSETHLVMVLGRGLEVLMDTEGEGGHPVVTPEDRSPLQRTPWAASGSTAHHGLDICDLTFKMFDIINTALL